jgi:hypothetical protein
MNDIFADVREDFVVVYLDVLWTELPGKVASGYNNHALTNTSRRRSRAR